RLSIPNSARRPYSTLFRSLADQVAGLGTLRRLAIGEAEPHAAQAEGGNRQSGGTELALVHGCSSNQRAGTSARQCSGRETLNIEDRKSTRLNTSDAKIS